MIETEYIKRKHVHKQNKKLLLMNCFLIIFLWSNIKNLDELKGHLSI